MKSSYDLIVVGAGPAGSTAAAFASRAGLNVLLLDKDTFPRDKICGDAISGKSVDILRRLGLAGAVAEADQLPCLGVIFGAPSGDTVAIPFNQSADRAGAPGYICARRVFDHLLVTEAERSGADVRQGVEVGGLLLSRGRVTGVTVSQGSTTRNLSAPLVLGADGAYSVISRHLGNDQHVADHYCAGVRTYCTEVDGFHNGNFIELHFVRELLPGYFWVFPMTNGRANVGLGMLSAHIKARGVNLRTELEKMIASSRFSGRFKNGLAGAPIKGWGLPLGTRPRPMAGDGWMLAGDAASLIDPFTGEGISNAMTSGEFAARWATNAHDQGRFDREYLLGYERDVLGAIGSELRINGKLQKLVQRTWLINLVVRKADRSEEVKKTISAMFDEDSKRLRLTLPLFYLRLLFA